ncbi:hypothetical protein SOVF_173300 [Spinacia oleracea]|nr:hypothetical protein SOVF_173300 [Spinacia oleracea]
MPQMIAYYCMSKTLLIVFLQLLHLKNVVVGTKFIGSYCYKNGHYKQNSTYQKNLNIVLSDLSSQASTTRFYNSSGGHSPRKVYGQFYCKGDVSHRPCQECVQSAAQEIVNKCNNQKEASIVYEVCTLSYANRSLNSPLETDPISWHWKSNENDSSPTKLKQVLSTTMDRLIKRAAYNTTYHGYATGEAHLPPYSTLYCLVQCSPDILGSPCERCLRGCYRDLQTYCRGKIWAMVFRPNCQMRYNTSLFRTPPATPPGLSSKQSSQSGEK